MHTVAQRPHQSQPRPRPRFRTQRTYNASYTGTDGVETYGQAREIDGHNLAFQADGSRDWRLVKRFDIRLMLYGLKDLEDVTSAAPEDARPLWQRLADPGYYEGSDRRGEQVRGR